MDEQETTGTITGGEEQNLGISADLIRGHISTIILRCLYDEDKYGYDIIGEIERKSGRHLTAAFFHIFLTTFTNFPCII